MSKGGFFDAVRRSHPIKLGTVINGRRVIATFNQSTDDSIWGDPWVQFDDGTQMAVAEIARPTDGP